MAASLWLSWQDRVSLSCSDDQAIVAGPAARLALRPVAPEIATAMQRLAPPGEDEEQLAKSVLAAGNLESLARWYYHVNQLNRRGLVRRSLRAEGALIATLVPLGRSCGAVNGRVSANGHKVSHNGKAPAAGTVKSLDASESSFVLSRFAYIRREGSELVVESPQAAARVILHDPRALAIIGTMGQPATTADVAARIADLPPAAVRALLGLLDDAGMLDEAGMATSPGAGSNLELESWEFHDLLFHSRSRRGRSDGRFGATYRLAHRPPVPALKPTGDREWHDLEIPDLDRLAREDPSLSEVQRRRRSIRKYGAQPITDRQLGEFLYRVGRVTERWRADVPAPSDPVSMDFASRPYPSGGALYELELYAAVNNCRNLAAGLYDYDPEHHRLGRVAGATGDVGLLLDEAAASAGIGRETVQVLIILAARFQRIAWKYESIAYSLILKNVGVLFQTMYLAATAMGLAPCALGCGNSDVFARAAGTDYYVESSVGEFLLGSRE